jgi:hypothetical protein
LPLFTGRGTWSAFIDAVVKDKFEHVANVATVLPTEAQDHDE